MSADHQEQEPSQSVLRKKDVETVIHQNDADDEGDTDAEERVAELTGDDADEPATDDRAADDRATNVTATVEPDAEETQANGDPTDSERPE